MSDTSMIAEHIAGYCSFTRAELGIILEREGYHPTESMINHMVDQLLSEGRIARVGRNRYSACVPSQAYFFHHSEKALAVAKEIIRAHPYLEFRIFELIQLNEFTNHQIAHNILFVSVESELEEDVFNTLWEKYPGNVMLKPGIDALFRYMSDDVIVVNKLPSESPRGSKQFWDTKLEKMLVDIAVDKLLKKIIPSGEYPSIYVEALNKYAIDKSTMKRYAARRGALVKYRKFLLNEAGLTQERFSI